MFASYDIFYLFYMVHIQKVIEKSPQCLYIIIMQLQSFKIMYRYFSINSRISNNNHPQLWAKFLNLWNTITLSLHMIEG